MAATGSGTEMLLFARCGVLRESSARLREHARQVCEASALLRRSTPWGPRHGDSGYGLAGRRRAARVVCCPLCGLRLSARELATSLRPAHEACYDTHLRAVEVSTLALLDGQAELWCRSCLARRLGVDRDDVYTVSGRLLIRRLVRTAASLCRECGRPRLVFVSTAAAAVAM